MKSVVAGVLLVLMASIAVGEEYREFTDTQGRSIRARIIEFDSGKGKLLIEREGGKQAWVAPGIFGRADQKYINEWITAYRPVSSEMLEVTIRGEKEDVNAETKKHIYSIELHNRAEVPLEFYDVEYRIICETVGYSGREDKEWSAVGYPRVKAISPGESIVLKTNPLYLSRKKNGSDRLRGIGVCIYLSPSIKHSITRACYEPTKIKDTIDWERKPTGKPRPSHTVTSLEEIKKRGKAPIASVYNQWFQNAISELPKANREDREIVLESMEYFYDPQFEQENKFHTYMIGDLCKRLKLYEAAVRWYERSLEYGGLFVYASLAEIYCSPDNASGRDGAKAVKYAQLTKDFDGPLNVMIPIDAKRMDQRLALLARAYATNDQFDLAVSTVKEAIGLLMDRDIHEKDLLDYRKQLKCYKNKMIYVKKRVYPVGFSPRVTAPFPVPYRRLRL